MNPLADLRYPKISIESLDHARAFTEDGEGVNGRLAVDLEGRLVFVPALSRHSDADETSPSEADLK